MTDTSDVFENKTPNKSPYSVLNGLLEDLIGKIPSLLSWNKVRPMESSNILNAVFGYST